MEALGAEIDRAGAEALVKKIVCEKKDACMCAKRLNTEMLKNTKF